MTDTPGKFIGFLQELMTLCNAHDVEIGFVRMGRAKDSEGKVMNEHFTAELSRIIPAQPLAESEQSP